MKKLFLVLTLVLTFSISVFADGHMPMGGKNCQNSPCLVSSTTNEDENKNDNTNFVSVVFQTIFDFIN
jgi:hypothetical protein